MLIIKPVQSKELQKEYCIACGVQYRPDALCYAAHVDDVFTGIAQFTMNDDYGYVYDLVLVPGIEDFEAIFIMGRATLNFIDLRGVHKARCRKEAGAPHILKAVGFRTEIGEDLEADLHGMFDGSHCESKHQ